MAKSRRKKNYKLKRRVMRTIAALTMIMAIVVAAIPVENYGTTKAAPNIDLDIQKIYDDYAADDSEFKDTIKGIYDEAVYQTKVKTRVVIGDTVADQFEVMKSSSNSRPAVITDYIGKNSSVDVNDVLYYGYFYLTQQGYNSFKNAVGDDTFTLTEVEETAAQSQVTLTKSGGGQEIIKYPKRFNTTNPRFDISYSGSSSGTIQDSIRDDSNENGRKTVTYNYTPCNANSNFFTASTVFMTPKTAYAWEYYDGFIKKFDNYNSELDQLINDVKDAQEAATSGTPITDAQIQTFVDRTNDLKRDYKSLGGTDSTLYYYAPGEIHNDSSDLGKNSLSVKFSQLKDESLYRTLCYRLRYNNAATPATEFSLAGFSLKVMYDEQEGSEVYVPVWSEENTVEEYDQAQTRSPYVTDGGKMGAYIVKGSVDIFGIGKGAFVDSPISSVKLSDNIEFIGDEAFMGCNSMTSVELDPKICKAIGNRAFKNSSINSITFNGDVSQLRELGAEAFYGCKSLSSVDFPNSIETIGRGCFAESGLTEFKFQADNINDIIIHPFAFYNCVNLKNVETGGFFPETFSHNIYLGFGSFAVSDNNSGAMTEFNYPSYISTLNYSGTNDDKRFSQRNNKSFDFDNRSCYDCVLANRSGLKVVAFPASLGGIIPDGTLAGCTNLEKVVLGKLSYDGDGENAGLNIKYEKGKDSLLFSDIMNEEFYVEGPGFIRNGGSSGNEASTSRKETAELRTGVRSETNPNAGFIPYKYKDKNGDLRMEVVSGGSVEEDGTIKDGIFLAEIDSMNDEANTARLVGYSFRDGVSDDDKKASTVTVDARVGGYQITGLGEGCFAGILEYISELIVQDGSISTIDNEALKGAENLKRVTIGNSVTAIGDEAFAGCPSLENVYFHEPVSNDVSDGMFIGNDAFKTGSEYLTFHGIIADTYAPFKYAMDSSNADFGKTAGRNICYKSLEPSNLTVMLDNETGERTLIDYPHIEDIGDTILPKLRDEEELEPNEADVVNAVLNIDLPSGIDSIDSKKYFVKYDENNKPQRKNKDNEGYLERFYDENGNYDSSIKTQINKDTDVEAWIPAKVYYDDYDNTVVGGLFSGIFCEKGKGLIGKSYAGRTYVEDDSTPQGNDHLTSINMASVKALPEKYTFDSCENLDNVKLGSELKDIGIRPFRGCTKLNSDGIEGNAYYKAENNIIYGSKDTLDYSVLTECLETRRGGLNSNTDPNLANVTEIKEEAFADCTTISTVDLEGTKITSIPDKCFNGAYNLSTVKLPKSVTEIHAGAFDNLLQDQGDYTELHVYIPNRNCSIYADAFDENADITIYGEEFADDTNQDPSAVYTFAKAHGIKFEQLQKEYTVQFWGGPDNRTLIKESSIIAGEDIRDYPRPAEEPLLEWEGHEFKGWVWVDTATGKVTTEEEGALLKVNEPRRMEALYVPKSGDFEADGNEYTITIVNGTAYGETTRRVISGTPIMLQADTRDGYTFQYWSAVSTQDNAVDYKDFIGSTYNTVTTFIMPNDNVTLEAHFQLGGSTPVNPDALYMATVNYGTGGGQYKAGDMVTISANAPQTGRQFSGWTSSSTNVVFTSTTETTTTFIMPAENVVITANFSGGSGTNTPNPDGSYTVTVNNGTGGGNYQPGATVTITANAAPTGQKFTNWTATGVTLSNANSASTTFTMPSSNVTVTANYSGESSTGKHKVTVNYGSGSGEYEAGATVNITANAPESSSRVFSRWTTSNSGLGFANANAVSTSFVMPATDVTVTANYRARTSDDDDDDDSTSRRPGTNTSTNTVTNRPGSSTNTTGTTGTVNNPTNGTSSGTTNNNNGNRIYITKNGISNTDVASLAVSGSTDNFIVRITESAEATAAVEQALTNTYGSLNGLAYLPMDISLYDATGQNKITDSTGLNITVTMPIPDVLIQYGGNARVAAADNGNLVQLTPRFTTIDGIACVSFVPPHFSPYVIYVDTNNLIAGQMLDATPATGDPIHPKWFAAIGMACVSVLLFVLSDGRKRKKYRAA